MFAEIQTGDVLMPSPLLTFESSQIRLHFQHGPDGRVSSPQVPAGNMRDLAEARYLRPDRIERASRRLAELTKLVSRQDLAAALAADQLTTSQEANSLLATGPVQESKISNEYIMRSRSTKLAQNANPQRALPLAARSTVHQGQLHVVWIGSALLLARRVRVEEGMFLQGCWLDWDVIRGELLTSVSDLLPNARLEPVAASGSLIPARMLASLPVRLVPGEAPEEQEPG